MPSRKPKAPSENFWPEIFASRQRGPNPDDSTAERGLFISSQPFNPAARPPVAHLDLPWEQVMELRPRSWVTLDPAADSLSMLDLRRCAHRAASLLKPGGLFWFWIRDPDDIAATVNDSEDGESVPFDSTALPWPGEWVAERQAFVRPWRHYHELFRLFPFRLLSPTELTLDDGTRGYLLRAKRLSTVTTPSEVPPTERYAPDSLYHRFNRLEEPEILDDLLYGASRLALTPGDRVLSLGVNDAREWTMFQNPAASQLELWGIDHALEGIARARERYPEQKERLIHHSLDHLDDLKLPEFQAVVALNTLQVTTIDRDRLLSRLTRGRPQTPFLVSIPNCHFGGDEILRRPLDRSHRRHDRGPAFKDLRFLTRFFYRAGYSEVETFGTYDLFLLARGGVPSRGSV